jgi:hypothetical protein
MEYADGEYEYSSRYGTYNVPFLVLVLFFGGYSILFWNPFSMDYEEAKILADRANCLQFYDWQL